MSKIRVYELAKELEISSKELIALLKDEFGIEVKNHMSVVEEEDAALIKELLGDSEGNKEAVKEESMDTEGKVTKSIVDEYEEILEEEVVNLAKKKKKTKRELAQEKLEAEEAALANMKVEIGEFITVKEFADKLGKPVAEVIKALIFTGIMAGINQEIDFETAEKAAKRLEIDIVKIKDDASGISDEKEEDLLDVNLEKRPPIVTVMGHVDHGKTSLLDAIRKAKVTESEAGGITQHIGAYTITINGEKITFLDTPGHEAFTAMRARGAQVTDIVILVVAADDGIMPQTAEAINHCKAANVPMIVAINKIDVEGANIDRVKQELTEYGLVAEEWGGDTICVPVSAKQRIGIDDLLEMVLLTAEVEELKADSNRRAAGTVIESELDKGRGPVATLLVQKGTLNVGDSILVGSTYGRIRAMFDDKGKKIKSAGPSIPVEILGLSEVPQAGDKFHEVKDEKTARGMAEARKIKEKSLQQSTMRVSLEDLYSQVKEGKIKELPIIIKADVQGSIEALKGTLEKLSTDEIKVRVIHGGVGAVTETDISLAAASNAVVIGFNVRPDNNAQVLAEKEKVYVKTYRVIYHAVDDIKAAMIGMLAPEIKEVVQGRVEIRQTYKVSAIGTIAGCYVLNGKITRNSEIRLLRDGVIIHEGKLASLKRFKDDAKEVLAGFECGLSIEKFNEIKEGDIIEAYVMESIVRKEL
ncbi:MAG TPA: translation initiation factor IF-2 [Proteiniclasticum sp.]|uniref:translation initiation factor IF-2 n=1 Tax=Proteiniclasticum sp. TaxID=2053595 RepID=UPI000E81F240|nr:translation initiation factor IF-2 [Proteiniclasticum sp.]HBW12495.1 translation initiation factor IF-2 [Proteiniclasticum sp.]